MSELRLHFPGASFSLRGPDSALRQASILYHSSHLAPAPADGESAPPTAGFTLEEVEDGWRLEADDVEDSLGSYAEVVHALLAMEHAIEGRLLDAPGVALHAGAVKVNGGACLLMGRADSGKSSTTFQLLELGHTFLAEEIAVVDERGEVRPHLQSIALDPRVVDDFSRDHAIEHGRLTLVDSLLYRYMPRRVTTEPSPLATILLPTYRPGEAARLERLTIEGTLTELLGYCFEPRGDQELFIERLIELGSASRLLRLSYPGAVEAREALENLFGRGAS